MNTSTYQEGGAPQAGTEAPVLRTLPGLTLKAALHVAVRLNPLHLLLDDELMNLSVSLSSVSSSGK